MVCASGNSYVIKAGDTLFIIAERELGDGNRWREIRKPGGTLFTEQDAGNLQVGEEICLPKHSGITGLDDPAKKEIAMQIVGTNENSTLKWRSKYSYIEDIGDGRGYTAGIVGFCSGTGDMLELVKYYASIRPDNILVRYIPALEAINGTDAHEGLDPTFVPDWETAATDPLFQQAQDYERDRVYFNPAVSQGKDDGLGTLGQFIYYDAYVMHGESGFDDIRATAMEKAETPTQGGGETTYLHAFLDARRDVMENDPTWQGNLDRIDTEQRPWVDLENLDLDTPLSWTVNDETFSIGTAV